MRNSSQLLIQNWRKKQLDWREHGDFRCLQNLAFPKEQICIAPTKVCPSLTYRSWVTACVPHKCVTTVRGGFVWTTVVLQCSCRTNRPVVTRCLAFSDVTARSGTSVFSPWPTSASLEVVFFFFVNLFQNIFYTYTLTHFFLRVVQANMFGNWKVSYCFNNLV